MCDGLYVTSACGPAVVGFCMISEPSGLLNGIKIQSSSQAAEAAPGTYKGGGI